MGGVLRERAVRQLTIVECRDDLCVLHNPSEGKVVRGVSVLRIGARQFSPDCLKLINDIPAACSPHINTSQIMAIRDEEVLDAAVSRQFLRAELPVKVVWERSPGRRCLDDVIHQLGSCP